MIIKKLPFGFFSAPSSDFQTVILTYLFSIRRARAEMSRIVAGAGMEPDADLGPVVTHEAKERIEGLIAKGEEEGANVILDGRGIVVPGYENGNFVGPTVIHQVKVCFTH